ncbi:MAG: hypothetical protein A2X94_09165 [Bdellovibrionales bacterium GWB1_55_8]|nr:MAG: hypothetical protein A2X94_09165 [Bdellovibrionales bacterium GWB1_55_8]
MSSWIEITNPTHGGPGWEFGTCLWSPVTNKGGVKSWELMRSLSPGDLVFHFLKQKPGDGYFLVAASRVSAAFQLVDVEPPEADRWSGMAPYYRVPVERFTKLSRPLAVDDILIRNREMLERELLNLPKGQFFEKKASGKLQVSLKYLAKAEGRVEVLLLQH